MFNQIKALNVDHQWVSCCRITTVGHPTATALQHFYSYRLLFSRMLKWIMLAGKIFIMRYSVEMCLTCKGQTMLILIFSACCSAQMITFLSYCGSERHVKMTYLETELRSALQLQQRPCTATGVSPATVQLTQQYIITQKGVSETNELPSQTNADTVNHAKRTIKTKPWVSQRNVRAFKCRTKKHWYK